MPIQLNSLSNLGIECILNCIQFSLFMKNLLVLNILFKFQFEKAFDEKEGTDAAVSYHSFFSLINNVMWLIFSYS